MKLLFAALALVAAPALAAERPTEDELFSAPVSEPPPGEAAAPTAAAAGAPARPSEDALFGGPEPAPKPSAPAAPIVPEDPLKIGGQLYLRSQVTALEARPPSKWSLSAPWLVDGWFDARPNERVRGLLRARLAYDPTVPAAGKTTSMGFPSSGPGPTVALDQLWLAFDVKRAVFVTAGKQHVKWGPAHFWNPTDFLHQVRRDPLAPFDARTGTTMLKLHVPWERRGWNFYGVGLFEGEEPAELVGRVGGGARAELVLGPAELGLDALAQKGMKPRFGVDLSAGVWELDVYAEASIKKGGDQRFWRKRANPDPALGPAGLLEEFTPTETIPQIALGASWSTKYHDDDLLTLGAEYFYNSTGYTDREIYPWLLFQGEFTPFYLGEHYLGVYGSLTAPSTWNRAMFTLSGLGNLSDHSYLARLDAAVLVLTHLRLEAFGAVHFGNKGGEFRFGLDIPPSRVGGYNVPGYFLPAPTFELGIGLRVNV